LLIALFAPIDVLDRFSYAKELTNWMTAKWPLLAVHANSTKHQQVALLVNCLTVAAVPVMAVVWFIQMTHNFPLLIKRSRLQSISIGQRLFVIFLGAPFFLFIIFTLVGLPGDPSWAKGFTTDRRIGMAVLNGIAIWLGSLSIGSWPFQIWMFIDALLYKLGN